MVKKAMGGSMMMVMVVMMSNSNDGHRSDGGCREMILLIGLFLVWER